MTLGKFTPDALLRRFHELRDPVTSEEFFVSPRHKKAQEIWCAAHFARGYATRISGVAVHVSEVDEQDEVDFEFEVAERRLPFQITEVQFPGRRRGDEYRGRTEGPWTDEDWERGSVDGPTWISGAIKKKAVRYGKVDELHLLVYVNFPAADMQYVDLHAVAAAQSSRFASVWALTGNALCCLKASPHLPHWDGWLIISESLAKDEP